MAQLPLPDIHPLQADGTLGVASSVTVKIRYNDAGSKDSVGMRWGIAAEATQTISADHPEALFSIPVNEICDGSATVWYSARDAICNQAYSPVVTLRIKTGTQRLTAPAATAADSTNAGRGFTASIANNPDFGLKLQSGDSITVHWDIHDAGTQGSADTHWQTFTVDRPAPAGYTTPALTPSLQPDQYMVLDYKVSRTLPAHGDAPASSQVFESQPCQVKYQDLWPSQQTTLPAPIFTQAAGGTLDLNALNGQGATVQIPLTPAVANTTVRFIGDGHAADGTAIAQANWDSGDLHVASTPYTDDGAIPYATLHAVPDGGTYSIYYSTAGRESPAATVTIKCPEKPPVDHSYPAPYFVEAHNGVLHVGPSPAVQSVWIRIDNAGLINKQLYFYGDGAAKPDGPSIPAAHWELDPLLGNPGDVNVVTIPRRFIAAVPARGTYTIYYRVGNPNSGEKSKTATVTVLFV